VQGNVDAGWLIDKGGQAAHATQKIFSQFFLAHLFVSRGRLNESTFCFRLGEFSLPSGTKTNRVGSIPQR
jgi:hypothetical protein